MARTSKRRTCTAVASGLMAAVAVIGLTACQGGSTPPAPDEADATASAPASSPPQPAGFAPRVDVAEGSRVIESTDESGLAIQLTVPYPVATVTGVDPAIADAFSAAVAAEHLDGVGAQLDRYRDLTLAECGGVPLAQSGAGVCERSAELAVEHAGAVGGFGTVATRSMFVLGSRDRNPQVHSVTMNLRTGEIAELSSFIDLADMDARGAAVAELKAAEHWEDTCSAVFPADYLDAVEAFSPTDDGLLLLWAPDPTSPAQCQVDRILVPWSGTMPLPSAPPTNGTAPTG